MAEPYIGEIKMMGFSFAPLHWSFCAGAVLTINQEQALFALIGTFYGGDGRSTFKLPNLVSRMPVGFNMGQAHPPTLSTSSIGGISGQQFVTLSQAQMPTHSHAATFTATGASAPPSVSLEATTDQGDLSTPASGAFLSRTKATGGSADRDENIYHSNPTAGSLVPLGGVTVSSGGSTQGVVDVHPSGASAAISILNPSLAINFSIAMTGVFPPRN